MNRDDFIRRVIRKPWADRACSFDEMDCWGLVVLYYRHVLGIEIHQTKGYEAGEAFVTCFEGDVVFWRPSTGREGDVVVFYSADIPAHIGLVMPSGKCLHSRGEGGTVRLDSLLAVKAHYTTMEFLTYGNV